MGMEDNPYKNAENSKQWKDIIGAVREVLISRQVKDFVKGLCVWERRVQKTNILGADKPAYITRLFVSSESVIILYFMLSPKI